MQKILLFVLVIFIINVQSVDVYTQATVDELVANAKLAQSAAKGKAAASKQANTDAQALATDDKGRLADLENTLNADIAAQKLTQDSYNAQLTSTNSAQTAADRDRTLLAEAHANVDANAVVVAALLVRQTAMKYTPTELTTNEGTFVAAVDAAGTAITNLQTQNTAVVSFVNTKKTNIGANSDSDMNTKKGTATTALATMGGGAAGAICKDTLVTAYVDAVTAWQAAAVLHSTNTAVLLAYNNILSKISTELTGKVTALLDKQVAVKAAATTLTYSLSNANSVLGAIQKIINAEQGRVDAALSTANAETLTLATKLSAANSQATTADSLWLASKQLLATQLSALTSNSQKTETQQSLYDARYNAWMTSQNKAYMTALTMATDAAAEKMANDYVAQTLVVQANVNVALQTDKTNAVAALAVVEQKAAQVASDAANKAKEVADAALAAANAGVTAINTAVKAEIVAQQKLDNTTAKAWNKSLQGDATAAKAACAAKIKAAKDANKSSTKLSFSVLSLIAGLLIMTMN